MCVIPLEIDELIQLLLNTIWDCPFDDARIEKSLILIPHNVALCQLYKNNKFFNSDIKNLFACNNYKNQIFFLFTSQSLVFIY